jgi:phosphopantetheine adenylyltransferase
LQFRAQSGATIDHPPQSPATAGFLKLLEAEAFAFEELYVATFQVLDRQWLATKASRMQFAGVLTDAMQKVQAALVSRPGSIAQFRERLGLQPVLVKH